MALKEEMESQGNYLFKYRSYLPIILLIIGLFVYVLGKYGIVIGIQQIVNSDVIVEIALLVSLFGLAIRALTVGYTPKNTSGRNTERQVADFLNTSGMYSFVRHPLYVGNFFMYLGIAILTANLCFVISFILAFWLYYERIMLAEEQFLQKKFGDVYLDWSSKTGAFIPTLRKWIKPDLKFSWKKVIKQEKNGLFAVFLVFFLFESIGKYIDEKAFITDKNWLIYATILSGIIYVILRYIKKRTTWLNEEER